MPVSGPVVGWLTGALMALAETAVVLSVPWLQPRTADVRVLVVGWVLLSSAAGGLIAWIVHPRVGTKGSGSWPVAVRSTLLGIYASAGTFVLLYAMVYVIGALILGYALAHSNIGGY